MTWMWWILGGLGALAALASVAFVAINWVAWSRVAPPQGEMVRTAVETARAEAGRLAADLQAWRAAHGGWPEGLAALDPTGTGVALEFEPLPDAAPGQPAYRRRFPEAPDVAHALGADPITADGFRIAADPEGRLTLVLEVSTP